jgi:hypothetical protein
MCDENDRCPEFFKQTLLAEKVIEDTFFSLGIETGESVVDYH